MKCSFDRTIPSLGIYPINWLLAITFHCFLVSTTSAQSCGFSTGKTLQELQLAIRAPVPTAFAPKIAGYKKSRSLGALLLSTAPTKPKYGVFLPQWSAENLPFFCKIEHDWSKNRARVPLKFRLGSVDYVDWLEGKGTFDY